MNLPLGSIYGMPLVVSEYVNDYVYIPAKNRREARKRWIIAQRRRRQGLPKLTYTRLEPKVLTVNGTCYVSHLGLECLKIGTLYKPYPPLTAW